MGLWQLIINGPGYFDTAYELREGVTSVGRAEENDIVLSGDLVSRRHSRFHVKGESLVVEDLGSRNGSKLNGEKLVGSRPLTVGDIVAVGENALLVRQPVESEVRPTDLVDLGFGGLVRRYGRGTVLGEAVVHARDVKAPNLLKALDNFGPVRGAPPPVLEPGKPREAGRRPSDTDEDSELPTAELLRPGKQTSAPVAWHSLLLLYRVTESLAGAKTLQQFLEKTCDLVMQRVGATTGVVLLRHPSEVMVPAAVRHEKALAEGEVPVSDAVIEAALAQGRALAVNDVRDDARFKERESVAQYGVDQVLCVPIGAEAPFAGVLYLNRSSARGEAVEELLDVCTAITQLVQTGLEKFREGLGGPHETRVRVMLERFHGPEQVDRRVAELKEKGTGLTALEARQVTVVFADIAGLPTHSAKWPAERVAELLHEFYRLATEQIFSFEGTVDTCSGDAVRAVFGAPYSQPDDAIRALRLGLALESEWRKLIDRRPPRERLPLRVALHTGAVLAGTIGGEARLDYTALGEPVQWTQWLCASAEPGQVLITGKTLAAVGARFDVTPLGERVLAGKARAAVFEVLDEDTEAGTLSGVRRPTL